MDIQINASLCKEFIRSYFLDHHLSFEQGFMRALDFMPDYIYEEFVDCLYKETMKGQDDV